MARRQKISQMTPKGANLQGTDLLEISEVSGTGYITKSITGQQIINAASGGGGGSGTVTSVDLTMPSAFTVTGNPITTAGTLAVAGAGVATQYIRGDGQLANFPTDIQSIPIVVNANITAENNKIYHVIANATFTDPTPVEGKGYVVLLVNGTFLFSSGGGTTFSQRGTLVFREFSSGNWYTLVHDERSYNANTFVPQSRTINGLDLSANRTLTTANINDSTNKRYVTDANLTVLGNTSGTNTGDQDLTNLVVKNTAITGATKTKITYDAKGLVTSGADATTADIADSSNKRYVTDANLTVIGNTSNTNTGDETQSSILSKLGWFTYNRVAESTAVTGTTTETIIDSTLIPANTYLSGGILSLENSMFRKVGTAGGFTIRAYIGTNSSSLTGATVIMTISGIGATNLYAEVLRTFTCTTTALVGLNSTANTATDIVASTSVRQSTTVDWTVNQYIHFTVALSNSADSVTMIGNTIKNF